MLRVVDRAKSTGHKIVKTQGHHARHTNRNSRTAGAHRRQDRVHTNAVANAHVRARMQLIKMPISGGDQRYCKLSHAIRLELPVKLLQPAIEIDPKPANTS